MNEDFFQHLSSFVIEKLDFIFNYLLEISQTTFAFKVLSFTILYFVSYLLDKFNNRVASKTLNYLRFKLWLADLTKKDILVNQLGEHNYGVIVEGKERELTPEEKSMLSLFDFAIKYRNYEDWFEEVIIEKYILDNYFLDKEQIKSVFKVHNDINSWWHENLREVIREAEKLMKEAKEKGKWKGTNYSDDQILGHYFLPLFNREIQSFVQPVVKELKLKTFLFNVLKFIIWFLTVVVLMFFLGDRSDEILKNLLF